MSFGMKATGNAVVEIEKTTFGNGSLGSPIDEERSELR